MQRKLLTNVLAAALAAGFATAAAAQAPDPQAVPPMERTNAATPVMTTPPANPETARTAMPMQTEQQRAAARDMGKDKKDHMDKDWSDKDFSDMSPQDFVDKALKSGHMEVASARTAQQRASDTRVRDFAQTLERDHAQLNTRLESMDRRGAGTGSNTGGNQRTDALEAGMRADKDGMHGKDKMDKLDGLQGAEFDRKYIAMQVKMHEKSIAMFQAASSQGDNLDVQALAREALPTLRQHLAQAKSLHESLGSN